MSVSDFIAPGLGRRFGRKLIERRLAAILGADIAGYSALMQGDEENTHTRVGAELERFKREIEKSHGRVFSFAGDGLMAEFPSSVEAVKCGLRVQAESGRRNAKEPDDRAIKFRIGLNSGELVIHNQRTGGTVVNIAARLEQLSPPGGISLSGNVFEQVRRIVNASCEFIGDQQLKNIKEPIPVYNIPPVICQAWPGMPSLPRQSLTYTTVTSMEKEKEYRPSLAVLPFRTLNPNQSDAYFAEGMVDDIISALGGLRDLFVIERSSSHIFAGAPLDLRRVGHELDVRYVVYGSVRRSQRTLRIAVELGDAQSGRVIWSDRYDGKATKLFELQDRIAIRVATAIAPQLRQQELSRAIRKPPDSMTAYDLVLQALDQSARMNRASLTRARELLEEAVQNDPDYAPAYSQLAWLYGSWIGQGWSEDTQADMARAANAARMAIERNPNDATALAIYGQVQSFMLKDYKIGIDYFARALAANPSCAWGWGCSSLTFGYLGHYRTAIERAETAVRLCPLGPDAFWFEHFLSQAYYLGARYDDAIAWARLSEAHQNANASNLRVLIASLVAIDRVAEARQVMERLLLLVPDFRLKTFRTRTPLTGEIRDLFVERLALAGAPD